MYRDVWGAMGAHLVALMYDDLSYLQKEVAREKNMWDQKTQYKKVIHTFFAWVTVTHSPSTVKREGY